MSKPVLNNRITFNNLGGIVNKLDSSFSNSQTISIDSSPTFANLHITHDTTIDGNLYVNGNTTIIDLVASEFVNNIILLNNQELGNGVTLLQAGIEIDRGNFENYRMIYDEPTETFRVGVLSHTQPVAIREESPLDGGVLVWDNATSKIITTTELENNLSAPVLSCGSLYAENVSFGNMYLTNMTTDNLNLINMTCGNLFVSGELTALSITTTIKNVDIVSCGSLIVSNDTTIGNLYTTFLISETLQTSYISSGNILVTDMTTGTLSSSNITCSNLSVSDTLASDIILSSTINVNQLNVSSGTFYNFNSVDNVPIIGYNAKETQDVGIVFQRYQTSNNLSTGNVIQDTPAFICILPSQITMDPDQCKLTNDASHLDNYYKGWWVKCKGQVKQVILYGGPQRVIVLDSDWTTPPEMNDTIYLYSNSYVISYFNENDKAISLGYTADVSNKTIRLNDYADIKVNDIYSNNVYINNTLDATITSGSLVVNGGCYIEKNVIVNSNIGIGVEPLSTLHLHNDNCSVLLEGDTESIEWSNKNTDYSTTLQLDNDNLFSMFADNVSVFCFGTSGNIGIHTTNTGSVLTIQNSNLICSDTNNGFLGLNAGNSNHVTDGNAQIIVWSKNNVDFPGNIDLHLGDLGTFTILNQDNLFEINKEGIVTVYNDTESDIQSGSVMLKGGLTIECSSNMSNMTSGGGLTVLGGCSINKDMHIGGDLYLDGHFNANGLVSQPLLTFDNFTNCSLISYDNVNLMTLSGQNILSFYVSLTPDSIHNTYCSFTFELPNKISNLLHRGECIMNVSGWTDNTELIPLFNVLGTGVSNSKNAIVKFANVNSDIHYIQIQCTYS